MRKSLVAFLGFAILATSPALAWKPLDTAQRIGPLRPHVSHKSGAYNAKKLLSIQNKEEKAALRNIIENMQAREAYEEELKAAGYAAPGVFIPYGCVQLCPSPDPSPTPIVTITH